MIGSRSRHSCYAQAQLRLRLMQQPAQYPHFVHVSQSGRAAPTRVLRQAVAGTVPRRCIAHPDVRSRDYPARIVEARNSDVDLIRVHVMCVAQRRSAPIAESSHYLLRRRILARRPAQQPESCALDRHPRNGMCADGSAARRAMTDPRLRHWRPTFVTKGSAVTAPDQHVCRNHYLPPWARPLPGFCRREK